MAASKTTIFTPMRFPTVKGFLTRFQWILSEYIEVYLNNVYKDTGSISLSEHTCVDECIRQSCLILEQIASFLVNLHTEKDTNGDCIYDTDEGNQTAKNEINDILNDWNSMCHSDILKVPIIIPERFEMLRHQYALNPMDQWEIYPINFENYSSDIGFQYIAKKIGRHIKKIDPSTKAKKFVQQMNQDDSCKNFTQIMMYIIKKHTDECYGLREMWKNPHHRKDFLASVIVFRNACKK